LPTAPAFAVAVALAMQMLRQRGVHGEKSLRCQLQEFVCFLQQKG